ncbi:MAG: mannose-1-phosphate guanylyltransferase [Flavitalea sp.]
MNKHHYVVIMAGGIGSRFWPMSRTNFPKQFLDILNMGKTLIQSTYERFISFIPPENIYVVTSAEYVNIVKKQLPDLPLQNILAEPSRKNTAPCIAYISFKLNQLDPNALLIVAPADHLISDNIAFTKVCWEALSFVKKHNAFITLGINPTHPNTGYGYIQYEQHSVSDNVFKVKTFTEKPNLELAKTFVASGEFLWNAGIFVWQVKNIIPAFEKYLPEVYDLFVSQKEKFNTPEEEGALQEIYPFCTSISIDFGIMEKADNVYVIPSSFGWSDLGTWNSAYQNLKKDGHANAAAGPNVMLMDTSNCIVHTPEHKLVVIQGLNDYILVDTEDVLLICKKDKEQEIKEFVGDVKRHKGDKFL